MTREPPDDKPMKEDALPCIWMAAGILSYRLCDRSYDCENCPLDAALHGRIPGPPGRRDRETRWDFPGDRLYHPRHGWFLPLGERRARVGLDALAAHLLSRLSAAILPAEGAHLERAGTIGWFVDEGELIPVRAAVPAVVERLNRRVQSDPELVLDSPYDEGWLLELRCAAEPESIHELASAPVNEHRSALQLLELWREAGLAVNTENEVGPTMADGGEPLARLREMAGLRRYHRLIVALLGGQAGFTF